MPRRISDELRSALDTLRASSIEFSPEAGCYVRRIDKQKLRGLTKILAKLFPVPEEHDDDDDANNDRPMVRRRGCRKSKNDPAPAPEAWKHPCEQTSRLASAAPSCASALDQSTIPRVCEMAHGDKRHGVLIDEQMKRYVAKGGWNGLCAAVGGSRAVDPCVATLLDYLRTVRLTPVASQLPIYSPLMDVATAIDILCTDTTTLREMHLIEIKSSMLVDRVKADRNYERLRGRLINTGLRGAPLSYCVRDRMQLWTMHHTLVEILRRPPASARVLRISPGNVRDYALVQWYLDREKALVRAIGQQTGQHKRNLKRQRDLAPDAKTFKKRAVAAFRASK